MSCISELMYVTVTISFPCSKCHMYASSASTKSAVCALEALQSAAMRSARCRQSSTRCGERLPSAAGQNWYEAFATASDWSGFLSSLYEYFVEAAASVSYVSQASCRRQGMVAVTSMIAETRDACEESSSS